MQAPLNDWKRLRCVKWDSKCPNKWHAIHTPSHELVFSVSWLKLKKILLAKVLHVVHLQPTTSNSWWHIGLINFSQNPCSNYSSFIDVLVADELYIKVNVPSLCVYCHFFFLFLSFYHPFFSHSSFIFLVPSFFVKLFFLIFLIYLLCFNSSYFCPS